MKMLIEMLYYDSEGYNHEYIDNICINFKDFKTDAEILAVQNAIQALPKLHLMTISSADDVRAARKLYEALPDEKKARVSISAVSFRQNLLQIQPFLRWAVRLRQIRRQRPFLCL